MCYRQPISKLESIEVLSNTDIDKEKHWGKSYASDLDIDKIPLDEFVKQSIWKKRVNLNT